MLFFNIFFLFYSILFYFVLFCGVWCKSWEGASMHILKKCCARLLETNYDGLSTRYNSLKAVDTFFIVFIIISQLRRSIEFTFPQVCYLMHIMSRSNLFLHVEIHQVEDWSLTITKCPVSLSQIFKV